MDQDTTSGLKQRIARFWDAVAPAYESRPGHGIANEAEHDAWLTLCRLLLPPPAADVLDLGTGTGVIAFLAADIGHRVTGTDLAERMLEVARRSASSHPNRPVFVTGDAVAPRFPPASFDAITNRHLLWTLPEPQVAFENWFTLLRPGGRVVIIDGFWNQQDDDQGASSSADEAPDLTAALFEAAYAGTSRDSLPLMTVTTVDPVLELLAEAGFTGIEVGDLAVVDSVEETQFAGSRFWILARKPAEDP